MANSKTKIISNILKILGVIILLSWCGLYFAQKIDLTTADLGRHIKNGEIILSGFSQNIFKTNFYSYTEPGFSFINHHWGSGVVFFLVWKILGFSGLSAFYILLGISTFAVYFFLAKKMGGWLLAIAASVLVMPLFATRAEVRPEMFTYLFTGIFFFVLWVYYNPQIARGSDTAAADINADKTKKRWLYLLPVLMLIWVNLHIGFFMGLLLIFVFFVSSATRSLVDNRFRKNRGRDFYEIFDKNLLLTGIVSGLAALVNPNFIKGALYPLQIFNNYGYLVVENQSVRFLERLNHTAGLNFSLFKAVLAIGVISFILVIFFQRKKFSWPLFAIFFIVSVMAVFGIRNFPFFGLFIIPILAYNINALYQGASLIRSRIPLDIRHAYFIAICLLIILGSGYRDYLKFSEKTSAMGIGLMPYVNASAEFIKQNNIQGPIFNDYDIGGYLIFHLFPKEKVFVDNRPEAYSVDFLQKIYIPAQDNAQAWQELERQENFNVIIFSHRDFTPWAQSFLISRVHDPLWAPVFVDGYNIVFLKRNQQNQGIISKFELPKSMFGINGY